MTDQFDLVSVRKQANIYFDGKCISRTVLFADGSKKTLGVIFPSLLTFTTEAAEVMEILRGVCKIRRAGEDAWSAYHAGQQFQIAANSRFEIETIELLDYVCHFG